MELVEEVVPLRGRVLEVLRPRDSEALIDERAFEHEERMPYWAELWPSGVALARLVDRSPVRGHRVAELGCGGLALPSIAASLGGARVLATDWAPEGLALAAANAERNGARLETACEAWAAPDRLVARAPWDLVLAADVLYEERNVEQLVGLLPRLAGERGEIWLADPGRSTTPAFLAAAADAFTWTERRDEAAPAVTLYRMRARRPAA